MSDLKQDMVVDGLDVSYAGEVCTIKLNRPRRRNACTVAMYGCIGDLLNKIATDSSVKILYLTGTGEYFTSGNDLAPRDPSSIEETPSDVFKRMVEAFIDFPKVIVVGVNGPAIGFGVTILGLVDFVYASDTATFQTPFVKLGLCPEGCSSYVFPQRMGRVQANEILLTGQKLNAKEALERRLINEVFPREQFQQRVGEKIKDLCALPPNSLMCSKKLVCCQERERLLEVNRIECECLKERITSEETMNAVMAFLAAKAAKGSKL